MNLNNTNTLKNLKFRRIFFFYLIKQTNFEKSIFLKRHFKKFKNEFKKKKKISIKRIKNENCQKFENKKI